MQFFRTLRLACLSSFLFVALASPGAQAGPCTLGPGDHTVSLEVQGVLRDYLVHVPAGCDPALPFPIVYDFHPLYGTSWMQAAQSGFRQKADEARFVVVFPQGVNNVWNAGWCCTNLVAAKQRHQLDELAFVRAIADDLETMLPIDRGRIYATGHSNGGALSHFAACNAADFFAGVAPVAFSLWPDYMGACRPSESVSVLQFSATDDGTVPYAGNSAFLSAPKSAERWAELDKCMRGPVRTFEKGGSYCEVYSDCANGAEVGLCTVRGSHTPYTNQDGVAIADLAWSFFSRSGAPSVTFTPPAPPPAPAPSPAPNPRRYTLEDWIRFLRMFQTGRTTTGR